MKIPSNFMDCPNACSLSNSACSPASFARRDVATLVTESFYRGHDVGNEIASPTASVFANKVKQSRWRSARKDEYNYNKIPPLMIADLVLLSLLAGCGTETISPAYSNIPPEILSLIVEPGDSLEIQDTLTLSCEAADAENQPLKYLWFAEGGKFTSDSTIVTQWAAPRTPGNYVLFLRVSDPFTDTTASREVIVLPRGATNRPPQIVRLTVDPDTVTPGDAVTAIVKANDAEGDPLIFVWTSLGGVFVPESGSQVRWFAPPATGEYYLKVTVLDSHHFISDSLPVLVVPDTVVLYTADFSTNEVAGSWGTVGLLAGLGTDEGISQIAWDSTNQAMAVTTRTNFDGTNAFRLIGRNFGDGSFSCTVKIPDDRYGKIAFVPKLIDRHNYLLISIDPRQGSWKVQRHISPDSMEWVKEDWWTLDISKPVRFSYIEAGNRATVMINDSALWQGAVTQEFQRNVPMGVALDGFDDSSPVLFDNFRVTVP